MSVNSSDLVFVNSEVKPPAHSEVEHGVCLEVKGTETTENSVKINTLVPYVKLERLSLDDWKLRGQFVMKHGIDISVKEEVQRNKFNFSFEYKGNIETIGENYDALKTSLKKDSKNEDSAKAEYPALVSDQSAPCNDFELAKATSVKRQLYSEDVEPPHNQVGDDNRCQLEGGIPAECSKVGILASKPFVKLECLSLDTRKINEESIMKHSIESLVRQEVRSSSAFKLPFDNKTNIEIIRHKTDTLKIPLKNDFKNNGNSELKYTPILSSQLKSCNPAEIVKTMSLKRQTDSGYVDPPQNLSTYSQEGDDNSFVVKKRIAANVSGIKIEELQPFVKLDRLSLKNYKIGQTINYTLLNLVPRVYAKCKPKLNIVHLNKLEASSSPKVVTYHTNDPMSEIKGSEINKLSLGFKAHNLKYPGTSSSAFQDEIEIKRLNPVVILERLPSSYTSSEVSSCDSTINTTQIMEGRRNIINDYGLPDSRDTEKQIDIGLDHSNIPLSDCTEMETSAFDTYSESSVEEDSTISKNPHREIMSTTGVDNRNRPFPGGQDKRNISRRLFSCQVCGKSFHWRASLNSHLVSHTGFKPYTCNHCGKSFGHRTHLSRHFEIHAEKKAFYCEHCMKPFTRKMILHRHLLTHAEIKEYPCQHCGQLFREKTELTSHLKIHPFTKAFLCDHCGRSYSTRGNLRQHLQTHTGIKEYTCQYCGKSFHKKRCLQNHLVMHTGVKTFKCDYCGKSFKHRNSLTYHLELHTRMNSYTCNQCEKSFGSSNALSKHLSTHTSVRPYSCHLCGQSFREKHNFQAHSLTHSGIRAFSCDICGKSFAKKSSLRRHTRSVMHTGIKALLCDICGKSFSSQHSLRRHKICHYGEA